MSAMFEFRAKPLTTTTHETCTKSPFKVFSSIYKTTFGNIRNDHYWVVWKKLKGKNIIEKLSEKHTWRFKNNVSLTTFGIVLYGIFREIPYFV